ncbi:hypothetical protein ABK046_50355, partial [Streptomyces caeruleatus]
MSAAEKLNTVTDMLSLPLPVAAQILGMGVNAVKAAMPVQSRGYRSKVVSVGAMRKYIADKESTPKPRI